MLWIVLTGVVVVLLWYILIRPHHYWSDRGVPQSKPWIILGDNWPTILRKLSMAEFIEWLYNLCPNSRYSGFYQFYLPTLLIRDPDLIKQITVKDFDHFVDHRSFIDPEAEPMWRKNLFALKGQKWREMRLTLSGTFTSSKLKTMYTLMADAADNFVHYFLKKNEDTVELELKDAFTRYTNDVIATTAFGIKVDSLAEPKNDFYLMGKKLTNFSGFITTVKFFGYMIIPKLFRLLKMHFFDPEVINFFSGIINETIKIREEKGIVRPDLINLLLEARKGVKREEDTDIDTVEEPTKGKFKQPHNLTNEDIIAQAMAFFFAGFDSISSAMCFGSYELATNIEVQDKLRQEIKDTFKNCNGNVTYDVLLKMKYLDMVVSEIMRKWPTSVALDRVCTKPYTIEPVTPDESPVKIKVGDVLWIPVQGIQRDPDFYPEPEKFNPERFSEENKDSIRPYTFLTFGAGPRNCIGSRFALLEIKVLLFKLLLNFEIVPTEKSRIPLKLSKKSLNLVAEGGFWFGLKRDKN